MNKSFQTSSYFILLFFAIISSCTKDDNNESLQNTQSAEELKSQIYELVKDHHIRTYYQLWTDFRSTDAKDNGKVNDLYNNKTNYTFGTDQDRGGGDLNRYNREHSVPKSWWGSQEESPMYTDLFHIYPTDSEANTQRSNLPFGEINSGTIIWTNGYCKVGKMVAANFSGDVFEPNNEIKGNLARTYFYFATRYENEDFSKWSGSPMMTKNKYPFYRTWAITMLLKWNRLDTVDEAERARNEAIERIQGKRNPFIDDPELAEYIWGDKMGKEYNMKRVKMPVVIFRLEE